MTKQLRKNWVHFEVGLADNKNSFTVPRLSYSFNLLKSRKLEVYNPLQRRKFSKQKEKERTNVEIEDHWGGPEAFKQILFLKDDFDAQVEKHDSMLIFFSASWCPHCLRLRKPYGMAALMSKEANLPIVFATYDVNHNPDFAQEKGVVGIPQIRYYKGGKYIAMYKGKRTSDELFEFAKNPPTESSKAVGIDF
ncbi:hypothetical protein RUM44_012081 [Polyplax serrata]|uniref:Thioredoxin domain-containing protein n=1 Tax=Polyplax serrata TaxID=468196 RepID=A0ABR1BF76_POLSC